MNSPEIASWVQAIFSVVAVAGAASIAVWQHHKQQKSENAARERKYSAARAVLPFTLESLHQYAENYMTQLVAAHGAASKNVPLSLQAFDVPSDAIAQLQACVEYGDERVQESLSNLTAQIQIIHARLIAFNGNNSSTHQICEKIAQVTELLARIDSLFPYARRRSFDVPSEPSSDAIQNVARLRNLQELTGVTEALSRFKPFAS